MGTLFLDGRPVYTCSWPGGLPEAALEGLLGYGGLACPQGGCCLLCSRSSNVAVWGLLPGL